jgi:ferredoxin
MDVKIDPNACMGCGICETIAPEIFLLGDEIHAHILLHPVPETMRDLVLQAIDECPERAIEMDEN